MAIPIQNQVSSAIRPDTTVRENGAVRRATASTPENNVQASDSLASDRVELSSQARAIQRAQEVAQEAPEVREDRVAAARRALENGTLPLDGATLADKIVQNITAG